MVSGHEYRDLSKFQNRAYWLQVCRIETFQDFFIKLGIKPLMNLLEKSIFSLNNDIVRPWTMQWFMVRHTKIMKKFCQRSQSSEFESHFSVFKIGQIFCEEYLIRRPTFDNEIFFKLWFLKYFIYQKCAQFLSALFIILISLKMTLYSEKVLISNRYIIVVLCPIWSNNLGLYCAPLLGWRY